MGWQEEKLYNDALLINALSDDAQITILYTSYLIVKRMLNLLQLIAQNSNVLPFQYSINDCTIDRLGYYCHCMIEY